MALLLEVNTLFGEPGPFPDVGPPGPDIKDPNALGRLNVLLLFEAGKLIPCELEGGCIFPPFPKLKLDPN